MIHHSQTDHDLLTSTIGAWWKTAFGKAEDQIGENEVFATIEACFRNSVLGEFIPIASAVSQGQSAADEKPA
jgi:hypothetical protein